MHTITIKNNILPYLLDYLKKEQHYVLIADVTVLNLFEIDKELKQQGIKLDVISIDAQEANKTMSNVLLICEQLSHLKIARSTTLIAFGGGVVGDIVGLVSLLYKRGLPLISIPTTLLAQVDSCYGGKVGVDFLDDKNILGGFKKADAIFIDPHFLTTLPKNVFDDGFFEALKYAILCDKHLFETLMQTDDFSQVQLVSIISRCLEIKASYVETDFFDQGIRAMLNLGHLFAHAIEKQSNFTISHGKAVGQGLYFCALYCLRNNYLDLNTFESIIQALSHLGLKIDEFKHDLRFLNQLDNDKQVFYNTVSFPIIKAIGDCELLTVSLNEIKETLQ